jgi:Ca2+-binding RTX toxin-like protein
VLARELGRGHSPQAIATESVSEVTESELNGVGPVHTVGSVGGNDRLAGDPGSDALFGGPADDQLDGGTQTDSCDGEAGTDAFTSCEDVFGSP